MPIANTATESPGYILHDNITRPSVISANDARGYHGIGGYKRLSVTHSAKEYVNGMLALMAKRESGRY